jgi:hypothetical protein
MKIIPTPIKNAILFSANINNKKELYPILNIPEIEEIMIIIKDTIPGNKLTIEVAKKDIFILRRLATK